MRSDDAPRRFSLDVVVAHLGACEACRGLLDDAATRRDRATLAALDGALRRHLARGVQIVIRTPRG